MRGDDKQTGELFSYVDLEARVRRSHPLRAIRVMVNEALTALERTHPRKLSITHISCTRLAPAESSVILSVTPNHGGVTNEQWYGSRSSRLA